MESRDVLDKKTYELIKRQTLNGTLSEKTKQRMSDGKPILVGVPENGGELFFLHDVLPMHPKYTDKK